MKNYQWGFIGTGNLVSAIIHGGLEEFKKIQPKFYNPTKSKADALAILTNGKSVDRYDDLKDCDIIVFGFKPQQFESIKNDLKKALNKNTIVISLLAAKDLPILEESFPKAGRIMTNTSCRTANGISVFLSNHWTTTEIEYIQSIFSKFSFVYNAKNEKELDFLTLMIGSGPALFYEFMCYFHRSMIEFGIDSEHSLSLVKNLVQGVAAQTRQKSTNLEDLISQVTSKGGVTFEALKVMKEKNIEAIMNSSINSGLKRLNELKHS